MKNYIFTLCIFILSETVFSQGSPPWESPLKIATSSDGVTFINQSVFQDSSGVPSVIKWKGDTLVCVFQWFRLPTGSASWDRIAVKFSYDNGLNWTQPFPILIPNLPVNYQRPFDPAIAKVNDDSLRIYFSSSDGMPVGGLDSSINTYSAVGVDGINFSFEGNPRFDHPLNRVIDPSAIQFNGTWQYCAPIGAPQDGAYHCTSTDGINYIQQADYTSDMMHNWTGNFMINDSSELRFYGGGQFIWYNSSTDGFAWQGFNNTNIIGGDPAVVRIDSSDYIIVYVGEPYITGIVENSQSTITISILNDAIFLNGLAEKYDYAIYSMNGNLIQSEKKNQENKIYIGQLKNGIYIFSLSTGRKESRYRFVKID